MRPLVLTFTLLATFGTSDTVQAQGRGRLNNVNVGVGVGPAWGFGPGFGPGLGWGYPGLPFGPYVFGYPGAFGSNWTNGLSLYGPPVPTHGPTPGAFGGGDAHLAFHANPVHPGFGYGWLGSRSPSPRFPGYSVNVFPTGRGELTGASVDVRAPREPVPANSQCLTLCVKVPVAAEVWIESVPMAGRGAERWFESPPLTAGQEYKYTITARLADDKLETKYATGKPGETLTVEFAK